jgi:hypothetical protein
MLQFFRQDLKPAAGEHKGIISMNRKNHQQKVHPGEPVPLKRVNYCGSMLNRSIL